MLFRSMRSVSVIGAVVIQALAFGMLHYKGFPFGLSGSVLAVLFALMMGFLRIKTGRLFYPWIAHFTANVMMGLLLYHMT